MNPKLIVFSLIFFSLNAFSGVFSPDHNFENDVNCTMDFSKELNLPVGPDSKRPIVCAVHKKKAELTFCEGDIVVFDKSSSPQRIYLIKDKKAYAEDTTQNRGTKNFTDQVVRVVKKFSCKERIDWLTPRKGSILAKHNIDAN
jgi:hypothetical protein